ncbi:hypothetical protein IIF7_04691 [Zunongwangia atlantica 22II14-10F7]|uniref:Uncharacterized protein n=1 Tax=Zunongwangia atlantica 22II14-10F7 TaxID=1185767 RepID=A0A1Y1T6W4_9FLAO|nr:hypothetical protein IIF7_04691 [Zunongwangia atlantica 22II14-10F7]
MIFLDPSCGFLQEHKFKIYWIVSRYSGRKSSEFITYCVYKLSKQTQRKPVRRLKNSSLYLGKLRNIQSRLPSKKYKLKIDKIEMLFYSLQKVLKAT